MTAVREGVTERAPKVHLVDRLGAAGGQNSQNSDAGQRAVDTHRVDTGPDSGQEKVSHILCSGGFNLSLFVRVGHVTSTDQPTLSVLYLTLQGML